jgi:hypothetical protein
MFYLLRQSGPQREAGPHLCAVTKHTPLHDVLLLVSNETAIYLTNTVRQTDIPALLNTWVTKTPVKILYPVKTASFCIFVKT